MLVNVEKIKHPTLRSSSIADIELIAYWFYKDYYERGCIPHMGMDHVLSKGCFIVAFEM